MNRKNIRLSSLGILLATGLLVSCQEKVPPLDSGSITASDTAFTAAVESPQYRHVLIEEFTGVSCSPCPQGHRTLEAIVAQHHNAALNFDSVSIIGIQSTGIPQAEPVHEEGYSTRNDNRTTDGTELYNAVYGTFGSIPRAGIDRVPMNNNLALAKEFWASTVNARLRVPAVVNISLTSTYNSTSRQAIIKVHVAYTGDLAKKQNLNVAIIENDIIDAQKNDLVIDSVYRHEHVLRDMITPATGSGFLNDATTKKAGQVYERTFVYDVAAAWVPEHCKVIAYVTNNEGTDREVQQSAEVSLK